MRISLRAGEKIFLNGAVIRVDRKVSLELLNDVTFLLEAHVLQADQTTTPLRQLYFVVQTILIDPKDGINAKLMLDHMLSRMVETFKNEEIREGLVKVRDQIARGRAFDALKTIRGLYPIEQGIIEPGQPSQIAAA